MTKRIRLSIILFGCCVLMGYLIINEKYSNDGILENVTKRDGYTLTLIKNNENVEFYIKPEWIPFDSTNEKEYDIELTNKNNTNIILDQVWNRGSDIYFNFDTTYNMDYYQGSFMYNGIFNEDGTFSTSGSYTDYYVYNNNDKKIDVGQTGQGPNSMFGFAINPENYELIKDGFYVKYSNFNLYEYNKN